LENLQALSQRGHNIVLRLPIVPGMNDDDENIRQTGAFAAALPRLERVDVLPYHKIGLEKYHRLGKPCALPEMHSPSEERIAEIAEILRGFGLRVKSWQEVGV
jgi:pyruvate formate lyase activating enzyme